MKNIKLLLGITAVILLFSNCNNDGPAEVQFFDDGTTQLTVTNIADARCPADVICVWGGNAALDIRVDSGDNSAVVVLNTDGGEVSGVAYPSDTLIFDTHIELISLDPVPNSGQELDLDEYTIEVEVTY